MTYRIALLVALLGLVGCGRTPMDDYRDGAVPETDGFVPRPDGFVPECRSDRDCDDGLFCTGAERCIGGRCAGGGPISCDDGVACTVDQCSEAARGCESIPDTSRCPRGQVCDPFEGCVARRCTDSRECQDGFLCNGTEVCRDGLCSGGRPMVCDDRVECTRDECSEAAGGCISRPVHARCDDSSFCNGEERCEPAFGGCVPGEPVFCNDGDDCTIDRCDDGLDRCTHERIDDPACRPGCPDVDLGDRVGFGVARGSTRGAGNDHRGSCGGDRAEEQTFLWRAPRATRWQIDTQGSSYDTLIYLLRGCGGTEIPGMCNDDSFGLQSSLTTFLRAGEAVLIVVDGFASNVGSFQLNIREAGTGEFDCSNFRDDDGDGLVDCDDPDCFGRPECGEPCTMAEFDCGNFRDDDCDGPVDCDDPDCFGTPECREPCASREFDCRNFRDEDCDGLVDCDDPDCFGTPDCREPCASFEFDCGNFRDEDCDGLIDCDDRDCAMDPRCRVCTDRERRCDDFVDNDCDGFTDCSDFDCRFSFECLPDGGVDAGLDGGPDGGPDAGVPDGGACTARREIGVAACTNRLDEDCDGRRDCSDTDCSPFGPEWECCNGVDDDGDGQVDIFTCRCRSNADCRGVGSLEQVCWTELYSVCAPRCNFYGGTAFCQGIDPSLVCNATTGQCVFP